MTENVEMSSCDFSERKATMANLTKKKSVNEEVDLDR